MFGSGARAYSQVGLVTDVIENNPHKLIQLLFEGARMAIVQAKLETAPAERGRLISKAISIISEGLKGGLNLSSGELALSLNELYDYMVKRLLESNLKGDAAGLDEVAGLLGELDDAWRAIPGHLQK